MKTFGIILAAKRLLTLAEFKFALSVEAHHRSLESLQATTDEDSSFLSFIQDRLRNFIKEDAATITFGMNPLETSFSISSMHLKIRILQNTAQGSARGLIFQRRKPSE